MTGSQKFYHPVQKELPICGRCLQNQSNWVGGPGGPKLYIYVTSLRM